MTDAAARPAHPSIGMLLSRLGRVQHAKTHKSGNFGCRGLWKI